MNTSAALSDDRIAAMRDVVTDAVRSDMARRGRQARRTLAGIVVAGVAVTAIGVGVATTSGSPSGGGQAASGSAGIAADPGSNADTAGVSPVAGVVGPDGSVGFAPGAATNSTATLTSTLSGAKSALPAEDGSQVITTGMVEATVTSPTQTSERLVAWVEAHGGRVGNRTQSGTGDDTTATLTVHVPNLNAAIAEVRSMGDVTSLETNADDVTLQVTDLEARIKALQTSVKRLTGFLAHSATTNELVRAEQVLTDRQGQLDSLRSQRAELADQVTLQTLSISLVAHQHEAAKAPDASGFTGGFVNGWNALVDTASAIVTGLGAALPWLGVLVVLGGLAWLAVRLSRRARS